MSGWKYNGFFALPDDVWITLLTGGYLILRDIGILDTAMNNHATRRWFLDLMSSERCQFLGGKLHQQRIQCDYNHPPFVERLSSGSMAWLVKRHMRLSTLLLPEATDSNLTENVRVRDAIETMLEHSLLDRLDSIDINGYGFYLWPDLLTRLCSDNSGVVSLIFDSCPFIMNITLRNIASHLPGLKSISLSENKNITKQGITALVTGCRRLEQIVLRNCSKLGNFTIYQIAANCSDLASIDVAGCKGVDIRGLYMLAEKCIKLKEVSSSCSSFLYEFKLPHIELKYPGIMWLSSVGK